MYIGYEMENHENVFSLNCFGKINKTMFRWELIKEKLRLTCNSHEKHKIHFFWGRKKGKKVLILFIVSGNLIQNGFL